MVNQTIHLKNNANMFYNIRNCRKLVPIFISYRCYATRFMNEKFPTKVFDDRFMYVARALPGHVRLTPSYFYS